MFPTQGILPPQTIWLQFESRHGVHLLSFSTKMLPVGPSQYLPMVLFFLRTLFKFSQLNLDCHLGGGGVTPIDWDTGCAIF